MPGLILGLSVTLCEKDKPRSRGLGGVMGDLLLCTPHFFPHCPSLWLEFRSLSIFPDVDQLILESHQLHLSLLSNRSKTREAFNQLRAAS